MNLKRYSIFSLTSIAIASFLFFTIDAGETAFRYYDTPITMPTALVFALGALSFFIISITYLFVLNTRGYFSGRKESRDQKTLTALIRSLILGEKIECGSFCERYLGVAKALGCANKIVLRENAAQTGVDEIDSVVASVKKIESGEYVDVKGLKLSPSNPLFVKNELNRLKNEPKYGLELLKRDNELLKQEGFKSLLSSGDEKEIKKVFKTYKPKSDEVIEIFRLFGEQKLNLERGEIIEMAIGAKIGRDGYFALIDSIKKRVSPDELIAIFEGFANRDEAAEEALIFILLDLAMIDKAKERTFGSNNDLTKVKAYFALKECGKSFKPELFFLNNSLD